MSCMILAFYFSCIFYFTFLSSLALICFQSESTSSCILFSLIDFSLSRYYIFFLSVNFNCQKFIFRQGQRLIGQGYLLLCGKNPVPGLSCQTSLIMAIGSFFLLYFLLTYLTFRFHSGFSFTFVLIYFMASSKFWLTTQILQVVCLTLGLLDFCEVILPALSLKQMLEPRSLFLSMIQFYYKNAEKSPDTRLQGSSNPWNLKTLTYGSCFQGYMYDNSRVLIQNQFLDMFKLLRQPVFSVSNMLKNFGIVNPNILRNLSVGQLYEAGIGHIPADPNTKNSCIASNGALVAFSGKRTGRSPASKAIVTDPIRQKEIAWGDVNRRMQPASFEILSNLAKSYLNTRRVIYVVDGYAGWCPEERIKIRVMCTRSYHALFMTNMLIRPTKQELEKDFNDGADYYIFNAGELQTSNFLPDVVNDAAVSLNFAQGKLVILGTQYAGEMKKGVFTIMNYLMPKKGHLPLHSSCNVGPAGDVCLFFGLSGTGKTALSAVGNRKLIGDDEHVWTDKGVWNIEGGCYAKCVGLTKEKEPEIYDAIRFGTVLENIGFHPGTRDVNFNDISITENTRASYPLEFIPGVQIPAIAGHPNNIVFLTCDAFSVLPPVSKLTPEQAIYHFYSGYTAKIAGTEIGVKEPTPTFSACFGEAFLPLKPQVYADLLYKKIKEHNVNVWLVNTGWTGGRYGIGKRISIQNTRAIINAIHDGSLSNAEYETLPVFHLQYPKSIPGVDTKILNPKDTWANKEQYDHYAIKVANMFNQNFSRFKEDASDEVKRGAPDATDHI